MEKFINNLTRSGSRSPIYIASKESVRIKTGAVVATPTSLSSVSRKPQNANSIAFENSIREHGIVKRRPPICLSSTDKQKTRNRGEEIDIVEMTSRTPIVSKRLGLSRKSSMDKKRPTFRPKSREPDGDSCVGSLRREVDGGRRTTIDQLSSEDEEISPENLDLRIKLHEEASLYKKRLDHYKRAQTDQATLISRLQAKVLQYKKKCAELEAQMTSTIPIPTPKKTQKTPNLTALEQAQIHLKQLDSSVEPIADLDTALRRLDDEKRRTEYLMKLNGNLRDQLEESHLMNETLTSDLQKLSNDWEILREEMLTKEEEWKEEEQAFNDYYSTEHSRLLNLWKDVVSMKRTFVQLQNCTETDLNKLKNEVQNVNYDVVNALETMSNLNSKPTIASYPNLEISKLNEELATLRKQREIDQGKLDEKDEKIQSLLKDVELFKERCVELDQNVAPQMSKMQEEIEILQSALRDIAHSLIQDSELNKEDFMAHSQVHLSSTLPTVPQKQKFHGIPSAAAFAESTISAVQAALHKYQSIVHGLQVKLQSNKEQLMLVRKQLENSEENVHEFEKRAKELIAQLDLSRAQCSKLSQDREILQKTLDSLRLEKNQVDQSRSELSANLENLKSDYQKLQKTAHILQKESEQLQDEKIFLQSEISRLNQDLSHKELSVRSEEDRSSRLREELLNLREELNKLYLTNDLLEQQKTEGEILISSLEKTKAEYEIQLDRLMGDKSEVHDSLLKKESILSNLEGDKNKLQEDLKKLHEEKMALQLQLSDSQNDIGSLKRELLQTEQQKLDLESDKTILSEKCKFLESEKSKIENELTQVTRERNDLSNQLTQISRKKEALNEESMRLKQKLEQANENNSRINRTLEDLVRECEAKQATLENYEKEIQKFQEILASVRTEKETLEAILFDAQTNLEESEIKRENLEKNLQDHLVKEEQLKAQTQRLTKELERSEKKLVETRTSLTQSAGNEKAQLKQEIQKLIQANTEAVQKLQDEKEKIKVNLEKKLQSEIGQLTNEKEAEIFKLQDQIENLQNHIDNLCQQHEELMLRAENDKQQALLLAHHDHQALHNKFEATLKELGEEKVNFDRLKRESNTKFDHDRLTINQLKEELAQFKSKLEEAQNRTEEEKVKLERQINELRAEKDQVTSESENLRVQLNMAETKYTACYDQLNETVRKLREIELNCEGLKKELLDSKRRCGDLNFEREKYSSSNKELRDHVKKIEGEKREFSRQLEENQTKISNLEESKANLESEKSRLQNYSRDLEKRLAQSENSIQKLREELNKNQELGSQQKAEEKELQSKLLNEIDERERAHQEIHLIRKQFCELERNLELTRKELAKNMSHTANLEEEWHLKEQDYLVHLEDFRAKEKRLEDQKHNLEVCLVDATQQIQELKAKLGGSEGKIRSLESQIAVLESQKRDVEQKLSSIVHTLKRIAGVQLDGTVTIPKRLLSPSRRWSPARDGAFEVDPENVRKGVRNLMHQVAQTERERDDFKNQLEISKKKMKENVENQSKSEGKFNKISVNLRKIQEEKAGLEAKLAQKTIEFQSQGEDLSRKIAENQEMRKKIVSLELTLNNENSEKTQNQEKLEKFKMALGRLENEKRALQDELTRLENRSTKFELQKLAADGDLQRLQMMLQEKDATIHKLQEKCENQSRTLASLEERCGSLKSTIEQLNISLERASNNESDLRNELSKLHRELLEATTNSQSSTEKLKQLQKALSSSENERKILCERFEMTQQNLAELRRSNQILQDQISKLNQEIANGEVVKSGLESQLRLAQWPGEIGSINVEEEKELHRKLQSLQREKSELKAKNDTLTNKLRHLENENRNLEHSISLRTPSNSNFEKYQMDAQYSEMEKEKYDMEIRELRIKITRLESELTEKELELSRLRTTQRTSLDRAEIERYRSAQLQAERLLEAREQSHRQQVQRLEHQVQLLKDQLNQEIKRRQQYLLRSSQTGREMAHLRQTLGDSLKTISQDPTLDSMLLEHETRRLDQNISDATLSLPISLPMPAPSASSGVSGGAYLMRSLTPQPK